MPVFQRLPVEPQDMFNLLRSAKISGVINKFLIIWREADEALGSGFVFDYEAKLSGLDPSKGERLMRWGGPVIRLAANHKIMFLVGRFMDGSCWNPGSYRDRR